MRRRMKMTLPPLATADEASAAIPFARVSYSVPAGILPIYPHKLEIQNGVRRNAGHIPAHNRQCGPCLVFLSEKDAKLAQKLGQLQPL